MDGKWKIDESGNLVAQKITTQELEVGSQTKPSGITIYDKHGKVGCIQVENIETGTVIVAQGACGATPASSTSNESNTNLQIDETAMTTTTNPATTTETVIPETAIASSTTATTTSP